MPKLTICSKEIINANILKVHVGTNCPQGGDAGHGGRTLFKLTDRGGTSMRCRVNGGQSVEASEIEIILRGDAECESFTRALAFALNTLHSKSDDSAEETNEESVE